MQGRNRNQGLKKGERQRDFSGTVGKGKLQREKSNQKKTREGRGCPVNRAKTPGTQSCYSDEEKTDGVDF